MVQEEEIDSSDPRETRHESMWKPGTILETAAAWTEHLDLCKFMQLWFAFAIIAFGKRPLIRAQIWLWRTLLCPCF
jgi:hypothetical protein